MSRTEILNQAKIIGTHSTRNSPKNATKVPMIDIARAYAEGRREALARVA